MRSTDVDRAQVYAAELAAFDGTTLEEVVGFGTIEELARRIQADPWWPVDAVPVRAARRDARSSSARSRSAVIEIRLAASQCTPATLVHELAHVVAGLAAGHDATFRRAHVDISQVAFGREAARWLADAYRAHGVAAGDRRWAAPPSSAIAL